MICITVIRSSLFSLINPIYPTMGNFELLSDITRAMRAYDTRRIYTVTSNFDHPVMPCEDYFCAQEVYGNHVRILS